MRQVLLFSTSTVHGGGYMEYAVPFVREFLGDLNSILFIPYARPSGITHDRYTGLFRERMGKHGFDVTGIHTADDPVAAVHEASAVFVGGGNTFVLLKALYEHNLVEPVRQRVEEGLRYMGSSAGSNVAGRSIGTTNDMPIVHPPLQDAFGLVPFNINPHYIDPDPNSTHMGETRETRIKEFHAFNAQPVVALREGAMLRVDEGHMELLGDPGGRLFRTGEEALELTSGDDLDWLLS